MGGEKITKHRACLDDLRRMCCFTIQETLCKLCFTVTFKVRGAKQVKTRYSGELPVPLLHVLQHLN